MLADVEGRRKGLVRRARDAVERGRGRHTGGSCSRWHRDRPRRRRVAADSTWRRSSQGDHGPYRSLRVTPTMQERPDGRPGVAAGGMMFFPISEWLPALLLTPGLELAGAVCLL